MTSPTQIYAPSGKELRELREKKGLSVRTIAECLAADPTLPPDSRDKTEKESADRWAHTINMVEAGAVDLDSSVYVGVRYLHALGMEHVPPLDIEELAVAQGAWIAWAKCQRQSRELPGGSSYETAFLEFKTSDADQSAWSALKAKREGI